MLFAILLTFTNIRELYVSNIPKEDRIKYLQTVSFILNSSSRKDYIILPRLSNDKIVFNLDDYGISPDNYDSLTHAYGLPRADWFIAQFEGKNYRKLLNINNLDDFKKLIGWEESKLDEKAVIVTRSNVIIDFQCVFRWDTLSGYLWETRIFAKNDKNIVENIIKGKVDSRQFIGSLPNGLHVYFACDEEGKALDQLDVKVAKDNNKVVTVGKSCINCHKNGIEPFGDILSTEGLGLFAKDKKEISRIKRLFFNNLSEYIAIDNKKYAKSLENVNDLTIEDNAKQFKEIFEEYNKPVDKEKAAQELNVTVEKFDKTVLFSDNLHLLFLVKNGKISRESWEKVFKTAQQLAK